MRKCCTKPSEVTESVKYHVLHLTQTVTLSTGYRTDSAEFYTNFYTLYRLHAMCYIQHKLLPSLQATELTVLHFTQSITLSTSEHMRSILLCCYGRKHKRGTSVGQSRQDWPNKLAQLATGLTKQTHLTQRGELPFTSMNLSGPSSQVQHQGVQ